MGIDNHSHHHFSSHRPRTFVSEQFVSMREIVGTSTAIGGVIAAILGVIILDPVAVLGGVVVMAVGRLIMED